MLILALCENNVLNEEKLVEIYEYIMNLEYAEEPDYDHIVTM